MLAKIHSYGINGLDAYPVSIEVDVSMGIPAINIVGLPDSAIRESKERVRSAIKNSGYDFGPWRITVNLSPADIRKEGSSFDLAIALGILAATEQLPFIHLEKYAILGALSLDGSIKPVRGSLSVSLAMKTSLFQGLILPFQNVPEACVTKSVNVYSARTLQEAVQVLSNPESQTPAQFTPETKEPNHKEEIDFSDIKGQMFVKRGLEIAASGSHNVLLLGPPGSGKSMLAKRFSTILPDMVWEERLETTRIHSIMGLLGEHQGIVEHRPFRSPHHTTSDVAIVGGGSIPRPGEVTLAHNGILFLDEFPEFDRSVLEALRQPLEDHHVTIARANRTIKFPSRFQLICAMNPCPCGFLTDSGQKCRCHSNQIARYMSKISGPLLDRMDLHLEVPRLQSSELLQNTIGESSADIKQRTIQARKIQLDRFVNSAITANAYMNHKQIKQFCSLDQESKTFFKKAIDELHLSARAYDKVLKVSRTIADLARSDTIHIEHMAEAIQYRCLDRNRWG